MPLRNVRVALKLRPDSLDFLEIQGEEEKGNQPTIPNFIQNPDGVQGILILTLFYAKFYMNSYKFVEGFF